MRLLILLLFFPLWGMTQERPIYLENPSFEGESNASADVYGWESCGSANLSRSVNDPALLPGAFGVDNYPIDGDTYLGLVTRDNTTWEAVSQRLEMPLSADWCYLFQIGLAQSNYFLNYSSLSKKQTLYSTPIILKIWGGNSDCGKEELLGQTTPIDHADWDSYTFYLCPSQRFTHLTLEAYYENDEGMSSPNGHILLDDASPLYPLPYNYDEIDWEKIPKSDYVIVEDPDQLVSLIEDYGTLIAFDNDVLPYQIYLDGYSGMRYGNVYFDAIVSAMDNFSDEQLIIAVKPNASGDAKERVSELKTIFREAEIEGYKYKIKTADKLQKESDWIIETEFLKIKLL